MANLKKEISDKIDSLRESWWALKNDLIHLDWDECVCAPCCYFYLKKVKKSRISKENFFLYWLSFVCSEPKKSNGLPIYNKNLKRNWDFILKTMQKVVPEEDRKRIDTYFMERDSTEHYRIISRLDKKAHLQTLIYEKSGYKFWNRFKNSAIRDIQRQYLIPFFESYKKYNSDKCYDPFFNPREFYGGFDKKIILMLRLSWKVIYYLVNKGKKSDQRELQRAFTICKAGLLPALDFLNEKRIVEWNRKEKEVSLYPNYIDGLKIFSCEINSHLEILKKIAKKVN